MQAAIAIIPLADVMRAAWDKAAYTFDGGNGHRADDEAATYSIRIDIIDEAIRSSLFWAYTGMVAKSGGMLEKVAEWSESCECHDEDPMRVGREVSEQRKQRAPRCRWLSIRQPYEDSHRQPMT